MCDGWWCQSICPSSVHCLSMVISWKLNKIDPQLLSDAVRILASLILLPVTTAFTSSPRHFPLPRDILFSDKKISENINTASRSTLALVHSCCQQSRPFSRGQCCQLGITIPNPGISAEFSNPVIPLFSIHW